jgi:hypothetical protein
MSFRLLSELRQRVSPFVEPNLVAPNGQDSRRSPPGCLFAVKPVLDSKIPVKFSVTLSLPFPVSNRYYRKLKLEL